MDLKKETKNAVKWTSAASLLTAVLQLLLTAILARYLDSNAFGVMAIALFVINFSQFFIDMGISNAIIYKQDISKEQLDTLYWLNILIGIIIFFLVFFCAPYVASYYENQELENVIKWISITFLVQPIGAQFGVLLRKELLFRELAVRTVFSQIFSFLVGILLAIGGYGVYALVFSNLAMTIISTILLVWVGIKFHRPSFFFSFNGVREFLTFGMYQMGEKIVNYMNHEIDSLIIGKMLGMQSLGVYNIAKSFVIKPFQVVNPILTRIGFPIMAKIQNDDDRLGKVYTMMISVLAYLNFPIFVFMFVYPELVVHLMFGKQWDVAITPLRILSIYSLLRSTINPIGTLQLAKGRADMGFYWNLVQLLILPISVYIGSFWGIIGVCISLSIFQFLSFIAVGHFMIKRLCNLNLYVYYRQFLKPLVYSCVVGGITYALYYLLNKDTLIINIGFIVLYSTVYGLLNFFFNKKVLLTIKNFR